MSPVLFIQLSYGIPSILLYIFVLTVFFRHSTTFDTMYYTIVRWTGICEIFIWLTSFIIQRFQAFPEFSDFYSFMYLSVPWLSQTIWIIYASVHLLNIPVLLAGVYRLFMIANPLTVDKIFRPIVPIIFIILPIYAFGASCFIPIFYPFIETTGYRLLRRFSNPNHIILQLTSPQAQKIFIIMAGFTAFYFLALAVINFLSLIFICAYGSRNDKFRGKFLISFWIGIAQMVNLGVNVAYIYGTWYRLPWTAELENLWLPMAMDLAILITPWIHILFNSCIRKRFFGAVHTRPSSIVIFTTNERY